MRIDDEKPVLVGHDAVNLHHSEEYMVRYPMKYGFFNANKKENYSTHQAVEDLATIISISIEKHMKLPPSAFKNFQCILVIPDSTVKVHMRYLMKGIFDLGFKAMLVHQESVMATFALSVSTAVVVDIGSSKTSVCCVEEGVVIQRSMIRKHFGGDD